jgi:hypothetical protein
MFRIQIMAPHATIWRAPAPMETRLFWEAMQVADRLAKACRKPARTQGGTTAWVVEIIGERNRTFYRAPVASA